MINHRREDVVLIHGGIGGLTFYRSGAKLVSQVEYEFLDGDAATQGEAEKVIRAVSTRFRIVEESGSDREQQVALNPQVFRA